MKNLAQIKSAQNIEKISLKKAKNLKGGKACKNEIIIDLGDWS